MNFSRKCVSIQASLLAASILIGAESSVLSAFAAGETAPGKAALSAGNAVASPGAAQATAGNGTSPAPAKDADGKHEPAAAVAEDESSTPSTSDPKKWRPGLELSVGTDTQDLVPTDDPELARKQVAAYPDSPEASFILAVALTRTSRVEEALAEVRKARKLADQKGGATYFDKMITTYEDLLKNYPAENRVRYGLAWAYYMKAYLLASYSRKVAKWKAANPEAAKAVYGNTASGATPAKPQVVVTAPGKNNLDAAKAALAAAASSGKPVDLGGIIAQAGALVQGNPGALPKIPEFTDGVEAQDIPQIHKYFQQALTKLDELLAQKPDDVWALVYRAHLKAEYTGNLDEAMKSWKACSEKFPNNPAAYFFLGEGYLKLGDLKQSISNVSKAVALRGMGN